MTEALTMSRPTLRALGNRLADKVMEHEQDFVQSAIEDLGFTHSAVRDEVRLAAGQLRSLDALLPWIEGRAPICADGQEAALIFPYNIVSWAVHDAACLVTAGNSVRMRFSSRAHRIAALVKSILAEELPGRVHVIEEPAGDFLDAALSSDQVPLLLVYGSERMGDSLFEAASGTRAKVVFEGPGKDPWIVLKGSDTRRAGSVIAASKFEFSGQQCIAPEILIADQALHDELVQRLAEQFRSVRVGEPADPTTQLGPMASARVPATIRLQLKQATAAGAEVVYGGGVDGPWVEPTLVVGVRPDMALFQEETFGPVLAVVSSGSTEEALDLARGTRFGLHCTVIGPHAEDLAKQLVGAPYAEPTTELVYGRFGTISVDGPLFSSDSSGPKPYGGYGKSGWIRDGDSLMQGPKLFAREATRAIDEAS